MATKKYYAIAKGRQTGVFNTTWAEAKQLVEGFPGARYKGFTDKAAAQAWLKGGATAAKAAQKKPTAAAANTPLPANVLQVYTDGGSRNTGNVQGGHVKSGDKAAWAYLIEYQGQQVSDSAGEFGATNNKMEITALVEALRKIKATWGTDLPVVVIADSRYVLNAITKNWLAGWQRRGWQRSGGQPLANKELWQQLAQLLREFRQIDYRWTKGHATNAGNVFVDAALNRTMDQLTPTQLHPVAATMTAKPAPKATAAPKTAQPDAAHQRASAESMKAIREQLHQMGYLQNHKSGE
ncbi:ribonuclease H family protein [Loigolactobacillus coryniformis]|uniref:Ribonuclease H n=1 Tax=Loigolactobacillus coryniformis TaxID=1610 RepID=A0A5B8TBW4_9LACO|nr:ribonuclease H family protein [Loigolactobacillus coryniformis]QEA52213.1 ribonuclease [Loigolactobacillus coryniformis]RRG01538.1 MAG: ribonuclease [Lactobacillus sp.]